MTVEINSEQWTGVEDTARATQVCGEFADQEKLDEALSRLEGSLFQRADLSVRHPGTQAGSEGQIAQHEEPTRKDDVQNLRQLGSGTLGAAAGMAAAGAVIATGGAALPAIGAAALAGGGAMAAASGVGEAAAPNAEAPMHRAADSTGAVLLVHANTPEKLAKAEELLRACGATRVWTQAGAAG